VFANYDAAKHYAFRRRSERRNLSGPELHAAIARYVQLQD
jgi:hypothetical protein